MERQRRSEKTYKYTQKLDMNFSFDYVTLTRFFEQNSHTFNRSDIIS